jgi:hypothetical protein
MKKQLVDRRPSRGISIVSVTIRVVRDAATTWALANDGDEFRTGAGTRT